jgi:prepilin-type N-terminal cleavage/methylation domain-containing protein
VKSVKSVAKKTKKRRAFTLIELVTAVALLVLVLTFSGIIFKVSIESYRTANANTEIMQKLRVVTEQLNADFKGLAKDGYLILDCNEIRNRSEYQNSLLGNFRADRLYYFSTGDFQSWFKTDIRSNIARIYFGHDSVSLNNPIVLVSKWSLARDVALLTPGVILPPLDCNNISYAQYKANISGTLVNANSLLVNSVSVDMQFDPNNIRRLMCQNVGEVRIEWTDGTKYLLPDNSLALAWFSLAMSRTDGNPPVIRPDPNYVIVENKDTAVPPRYYWARWTPATPTQLWPKAIKFTFTLYDSKRILREGRPFTHIVYLD